MLLSLPYKATDTEEEINGVEYEMSLGKCSSEDQQGCGGCNCQGELVRLWVIEFEIK